MRKKKLFYITYYTLIYYKIYLIKRIKKFIKNKENKEKLKFYVMKYSVCGV